MPVRAPTLKKLRGGKYQVRWEEESGRQRAKNFFSRELAQEFLKALHRGEADERARVTGKTFGDILDQWRRDRYGSLSTGTRVRYDNLIRLHFGSLLKCRIRELTAARVDRWIDELKAAIPGHGKEALRASFGHELTLLRAILAHYVDTEDDPHFVMPVKKRHRRAAVVKARPRRAPKDLSEADFQRFLARLEQDYGGTIAALAVVQFYQACRVSEPAALRWQDVRFDWEQPWRSRLCFEQHVVYARSKAVDDVIEPGIKNDDEKEHPMLPPVFEALRGLWRPGVSGLVFRGDDGGFLGYRWVQYRYDQTFERLGLPYRSTHVMRHGGTRKTFNETGGDRDIAAQQLGNRAAVEVYAKRSTRAFTEYAEEQWRRAQGAPSEGGRACGVHSAKPTLTLIKDN
jgi:integrase